MKFFIFRNNTLENIFGTDEVEYSGYEDISYIPQNTSLYLWMYQIPIRWNQKQLADEIDAYIRKMQFCIYFYFFAAPPFLGGSTILMLKIWQH